MDLLIKIVEFQGKIEAREHRLEGYSTSLGRSDQCDIVLINDNGVSREHGVINRQDGHYRYTDHSTNGTIVINRDLHLKHTSTEIDAGDLLKLGDYILAVELMPTVKEILQQPQATKPFDQGYQSALQDILAAAGLENIAWPPSLEPRALADRLGQLLEAYTCGLRTALSARTQVKQQLRADLTQMAPKANNPLKFSVDERHSLENLIYPEQLGFSDGLTAIEQGFSDLIQHELALMKALQSSFSEHLKAFSPEHFEDTEKNAISFQKKIKAWDNYCNSYPDRRDEALRELLGDAFRIAYEEQIKKFRSDQDSEAV
ncbi:MAG: FHA domain-containing protein [Gammaproteobacteria bacterium]|nr:FHA domain-containing protein [Gammaproteobacteria bacterium]NBT44992.1 FHA domain-containing protein [Gammaproteobacteria bacterium]NBY23117.1 FHA domain-containing protein [Gammaproteobacteria bacterium]NDE33477.1 FHA domain-containing protein [Gammaproteobacteria bacterium]NDE55585.1 FHA domain-containing protein [Gammaproteobacteria bacterium]